MENNEQNDVFKNDMQMPADMQKAQELQAPKRKRKAPLTVGAIFTIIGTIVFGFYVLYMFTIGQAITSNDASGFLAIFILPLAILIGMASCILNLVGLINSICAIRSDISGVKKWGIILTIISTLLIVAAVAVFFIVLYALN